ncbi:MAG: DUF6325 family protein [Anaerolineae bacterium]|jgi:hypothetical protein
MQYGPVDVVVVALGEPRFDGSVVAELERHADAGTIRLLDAMVLTKDEHGTRTSLDIEDLPEEEAAALGFINTGTRGLFDASDAEILFEGMVPGSAIVALAIEHAWARGLVQSLLDSGAEVAMNYRIPAPIVEEAMTALTAEA